MIAKDVNLCQEKKECHLNSMNFDKCPKDEFCNLVDSRLRREDIIYDIEAKTFFGFCAFCLYDDKGKPLCNYSHRRVMLSFS